MNNRKRRINRLLEKELDFQVAKRLGNIDNERLLDDFTVRGKIAEKRFKVDENDGWE